MLFLDLIDLEFVPARRLYNMSSIDSKIGPADRNRPRKYGKCDELRRFLGRVNFKKFV